MRRWRWVMSAKEVPFIDFSVCNRTNRFRLEFVWEENEEERWRRRGDGGSSNERLNERANATCLCMCAKKLDKGHGFSSMMNVWGGVCLLREYTPKPCSDSGYALSLFLSRFRTLCFLQMHWPVHKYWFAFVCCFDIANAPNIIRIDYIDTHAHTHKYSFSP